MQAPCVLLVVLFVPVDTKERALALPLTRPRTSRRCIGRLISRWRERSYRVLLPPPLMQRMFALAAVASVLFLPGCSLPGISDKTPTATPPMIGSASAGDGVTRRAKYRSSYEVSNSRKELLASATRTDEAAKSNSTPQSIAAPADATQPYPLVAGATGMLYPQTTPTVTAAPIPPVPLKTQRLPDVRHVSYETYPH